MREAATMIYLMIGAGSAIGVNLQFDEAEIGFRVFVSAVSLILWPLYIGVKLVSP